MANELLIKKTAVGSFALTNAAATIASGVMVPAGAIVTGIHIASPDAVTITGASQTVVPKVGTTSLAATVNVSDLPAQTVAAATALATTAGIYIAADGELNLVCGASGTSTASGTYDYYVDYLYFVS